jgi:hypothetical protein
LSTTARIETARDPFEKAHALFGEMITWLGLAAHEVDHTAIETGLRERGYELLRTAYQGHLDQRFEREREALRADLPPGKEARPRARGLETIFGRVVVRRAALLPRRPHPRLPTAAQLRPGRRPRSAPRGDSMPADARLSLPRETYSAPLREQTVLHVLGASYERAGEQVDRATAGHVPHRQQIELVTQAAQDVDAFYAERPQAANDTLSAKAFEMMSADGKGVRMRPEGLRDDTLKLAQQEARPTAKGDPMAPRRVRTHDRRMAVVTANWEQEPRVRTPQDIVRDLTAPKTGRPQPIARGDSPRKDLPRPQNKRVHASLERGSREQIAEVFAEADRRDPERHRPRVMLVDGSESQLTHVTSTATVLGVAVTIIVDVIHVLHYLWELSLLLSPGTDAVRETWVREHLMRLMTRPAAFVVSGLRQAATLRGLVGADRKAVDAGVNYLAKNAAYLDYGAYLAAGMPIATGVIEGTCRYLVQDRMGITGARWGLKGGEAVLKLRSVWASGDWNAFWKFHVRKEHERSYPAAKAA